MGWIDRSFRWVCIIFSGASMAAAFIDKDSWHLWMLLSIGREVDMLDIKEQLKRLEEDG